MWRLKCKVGLEKSSKLFRSIFWIFPLSNVCTFIASEKSRVTGFFVLFSIVVITSPLFARWRHSGISQLWHFCWAIIISLLLIEWRLGETDWQWNAKFILFGKLFWFWQELHVAWCDFVRLSIVYISIAYILLIFVEVFCKTFTINRRRCSGIRRLDWKCLD